MSQLLTALGNAHTSALERSLEEGSYFVGIDLGTTNSSLAVVDAQALVDGDLRSASRRLRRRRDRTRSFLLQLQSGWPRKGVECPRGAS